MANLKIDKNISATRVTASTVIAIFGWPLTSFIDAESAVSNLYTLSYIILGLMVLSILAGFPFDLQYQAGK